MRHLSSWGGGVVKANYIEVREHGERAETVVKVNHCHAVGTLNPRVLVLYCSR